jgi:predicted MFS family arabinose efflux permease
MPDAASALPATRAIFLVHGTIMSSWAPLVPIAKAQLGVSDGVLGGILLGLGAGAIVAMPIAGLLSVRIGSRTVTTVSAFAFCGVLPFLALADTPVLLALALFAFGAAAGSMDVTMNTQAVAVERKSARPVMSSFHGMYSIGGFLGAGAVSFVLDLGLTPLEATLAIAVVAALVTGLAARAMLPPCADARSGGLRFAWPHGIVWVFGLLTFATFLTEGAVMDWSAVFLTDQRNQDEGPAGLGFACFSIAMAVGRLTGDRLVARLGPVAVMRGGAALAAAGLAGAVALPWPEAALAGFVLVGFGAANIVPVLFSALGRIPGTDPGVALSAAATLGYAGILAGPGLIGLAASVATLPVALAGVAFLLLPVVASAPIVRR